MFSARTEWSLTPNRLHEAVEKRRAAGRSLVDLTISNPSLVGLGWPDAEGLRAALSQTGVLTYAPEPFGSHAARLALASWFAGRGLSITPERLCLTASTSEAYAFLFKLLCNPGDAVLVPAPSYPLFEYLATLEEVVLLPYQLRYDGEWHIDVGSLDEALSARDGAAPPRAIVAIHPNNPTGNYLKPAELDLLIDRCVSHGLALISDEVFYEHSIVNAGTEAGATTATAPAGATTATRAGATTNAGTAAGATTATRAGATVNAGTAAGATHSDDPSRRHHERRHGGRRHHSDRAGATTATAAARATTATTPAARAAARDECLTFSLGGLSKLAGLPQLKLGWIAASGPHAQLTQALARLEIIADSFLSVNTPAQLALPYVLGGVDAFLTSVKARLQHNLLALDRALAAARAATRLRCEGGWSAMVRLPATRSSEEWALHLLEQQGVLVQPGFFYDLGDALSPDASIVLSLLCAEEPFAVGVSALGELSGLGATDSG